MNLLQKLQALRESERGRLHETTNNQVSVHPGGSDGHPAPHLDDGSDSRGGGGGSLDPSPAGRGSVPVDAPAHGSGPDLVRAEPLQVAGDPGDEDQLDDSVSVGDDEDRIDDGDDAPRPGESGREYVLRLRAAAVALPGASNQRARKGVLPSPSAGAVLDRGVPRVSDDGQVPRGEGSLLPGHVLGRAAEDFALAMEQVGSGVVAPPEEPEQPGLPVIPFDADELPELEFTQGRQGTIVTNFFIPLQGPENYIEVEDYEASCEPDPMSAAGDLEVSSFTQPLEALFARMGAKSQLRTWLVQNFPPHYAYVEPFGGSFKVLLWKTQRSRIEIINDFDSDLVSFYRYVAQAPDLLVRAINAMPTHEAVILGLRNDLAQRKLRGLERAVAFYLSSQSAFNAKGDYSSYASSPQAALVMKVGVHKKDVLTVSERLQKVDIRSTGYERIIKACNKLMPHSAYPAGKSWKPLTGLHKSTVFFYLDPPYYETAGYRTLQGESSFGLRDQENLARLCFQIHQMGNLFIQTNSAHPKLREIYGGFKNSDGSPAFHIETRDVYYSVAGSADERKAAGEFVISNFELATQRAANLKQQEMFIR